MALAKLKADPFTRATLGTSGLEAVSRNLWLMDCQSCGPRSVRALPRAGFGVRQAW